VGSGVLLMLSVGGLLLIVCLNNLSFPAGRKVGKFHMIGEVKDLLITAMGFSGVYVGGEISYLKVTSESLFIRILFKNVTCDNIIFRNLFFITHRQRSHTMLDTSQCQKPEKRMSFRGIRASKFRHVFGSSAKKEKCFENIRITRNAHDGNYCAVNPKFLAVVVEVEKFFNLNIVVYLFGFDQDFLVGRRGRKFSSPSNRADRQSGLQRLQGMIFSGSCVDPKLLFSDPDPDLGLISDPDTDPACLTKVIRLYLICPQESIAQRFSSHFRR
jgi:hypothetical protein